MKIRALVFEDDALIRAHLCHLLERRGYEVFAFPEPGLCPLQSAAECPCPAGQVCGDILISDVQMPGITGLKFIESQKKKGCKLKHLALVSGSWSDSDRDSAQKMGCQTFPKPFSKEGLSHWLQQCEQGIDAARVLSDWFLSQLSQPGPNPIENMDETKES